MKAYRVAGWARMSLFALLGTVTYWMGHHLFTWEFWVLLFIMATAVALAEIETKLRYEEWLKNKKVISKPEEKQ